MSTTQVDNVMINGVLIFKRIDVTDLDEEGVFEFDVDSGGGGHLFLDDGLTLKGIRILSGGDPLEIDGDQEVMIVLSSSGVASIVHESGDVTNQIERIRTSDGLSVGVDSKRIQLFWSTAGGFRRWECPHW